MKSLLHQILSLGCLCLCFLLSLGLMTATPAQATQWQLTGQSADGLSQQYADLDSLRGAGSIWTIDSYFTEEQPGTEGSRLQNRADYITQYDCEQHRYKDVLPDGSEPDAWGDASADPFNQATMDYVCSHLPESSHEPKNSHEPEK